MDAERMRAYLLTLPHVTETMQWGANLVFWVGDKAHGGKMFAMINLDEPAAPELAGHKPRPVISYASSPMRFAELIEREDMIPAPYLARAHWVSALRWDTLASTEWRNELVDAHGLVLAKLPAKIRGALTAKTQPSPKRAAKAQR